MPLPAPIASVEEFYAHALAIEREAASRYTEFAAYLDRRGEVALAGLCRNLARLEQEHFDDLASACTELDLTLPEVAEDQYGWILPEVGETSSEEARRIPDATALLEIALKAELRARDFFVWIAGSALTRQVRELAAVMAAEEREHVQWVRDAMEYRGASKAATTPR